VVTVHRHTQLMQVVGALGAGRRFTHLLDRRQKQADEHRDDGDNHQQLDQRETRAAIRAAHGGPSWNATGRTSSRKVHRKQQKNRHFLLVCCHDAAITA
jgi:hypothetical protein